MKYGEVSFTQGGVQATIVFNREHADSIVADYASRSNDYPIDCEHQSYRIAKALGIEEDALPWIDFNKAALGWWKPEARADGLYAIVTKWNDAGATLMENSLWRYFSPVIRGIASGNIRVTSIALTNNPALDQLDAIAASADLDTEMKLKIENHNQKTKGKPMKKLAQALTVMLGLDAVALSADGDISNEDAVIQALNSYKATKEGATRLISGVRDTLALSADADIATVTVQAVTALEKGKADAIALSALQTEMTTIKATQATEKVDGLIAAGRTAGKIVGVTQETALRGITDVAALSALIDGMPVIIDPTRVKDKYPEKDNDTVALSAEESTFFSKHGLSSDDLKEYGGTE